MQDYLSVTFRSKSDSSWNSITFRYTRAVVRRCPQTALDRRSPPLPIWLLSTQTFIGLPIECWRHGRFRPSGHCWSFDRRRGRSRFHGVYGRIQMSLLIGSGSRISSCLLFGLRLGDADCHARRSQRPKSKSQSTTRLGDSQLDRRAQIHHSRVRKTPFSQCGRIQMVGIRL